MAGTPHAEQAANGYGKPVDGDYLTVFAAEGEDKPPIAAPGLIHPNA
jgi:hypothetical protein